MATTPADRGDDEKKPITPRRRSSTPETTPESPAPDAGSSSRPTVGIVMGSSSDLGVMRGAVDVLSALGIDCEVGVRSAHRDPFGMLEYGRTAAERGLRVLIAGAGGAAHLPGMLASVTTLPVIGVPVPLKVLDGLDSLLSIVQMPAGVPVAAVGVGNATNAGLLAARILATADPALQLRVADHQAGLRRTAAEMDEQLPGLLDDH